MNIIMFRLNTNGRCAIILPDGFLFGTDNAKVNIKKKLISEFNLHTVVRLPHSVFVPYTSITTNILFFDNTHPTEETWFYRLDMPEGYKNFSKTKPMKLEHFTKDFLRKIEDKQVRKKYAEIISLYCDCKDLQEINVWCILKELDLCDTKGFEIKDLKHNHIINSTVEELKIKLNELEELRAGIETIIAMKNSGEL